MGVVRRGGSAASPHPRAHPSRNLGTSLCPFPSVPQIDYLPFRRKFYIQSREITRMSEEEVQSVLERNEIKVRGKKCPRPILEWHHCGLSDKTMHVIRRQGYERPFAVQMQALPAIMNGRDVIGVAKTGSGKTLAFLLPMFRHIADQPPLAEGEGPVALVMAPARELAVQIFNETRKFARVLGLRVAAIYGGASVAEQIADLKRGAEIIVCTPGRMIDLMTMNAGRLISLHRVTYVVLDEADRMFDMGFGPQIEEVVKNIRPDRQTVMFSATFPSHVEHMARTMLRKPLEIIVGRRSAVSSEVEQIVEMREEREKWRRLLQILGVWHDRGNALIFVDTQERCDEVFSDLMKAGYFALSLHGGMDQVDRDQTIADFKNKLRTIMVATSVAGRGLDVRDLVLVVNFNCPNHLEDYVHRVGRTGRAGNKVRPPRAAETTVTRAAYLLPLSPGHGLHVHHTRGGPLRPRPRARAQAEQDRGPRLPEGSGRHPPRKGQGREGEEADQRLRRARLHL